jgi:cell division protease FtsH
VGPPGCGKTLLAKAIASEANVPFISIAGSEFVEVFVGVGASRVRQLFKKARQMAYAHGACIIFIDELDVIGRGRSFSFMGGGGETNSTQNQLLVEMDGLENAKQNILVVGATNASEDVLDTALMRPGRFDRKIFVSLPNLKDREELLKYYLNKVKFDENVDVKRLAQKLVYKSPADIENVVKEAALIAASRKGKEKLDKDDISEAVERIELGMETHLTMTPEQLEQTAFHEAGHAMVLYYLHPTDDVFKATIKSRGQALGLVWHHPREELHTFNREKLLADIKVSLAGFAAEKIKYGTTSTGVSSDFTHAMKTAHRMVWSYGMGSIVGDFSAIPDSEMSDQIKEKLNMETVSLINECLIDVEKFLRQEWQVVETFAKELISKQELDYEAIDTLLKAVKGGTPPAPAIVQAPQPGTDPAAGV